jgi:hypothetical protein
MTMHGAIATVTNIAKAAEWGEQAVKLAAACGDPAAERTSLTRLMWARHLRAQSSDAELARYRILVDAAAPDLVYLSGRPGAGGPRHLAGRARRREGQHKQAARAG